MNWVVQGTLIKSEFARSARERKGTTEGMREAPQPPRGKRPVEDTTAAMQRIIDQAMELVPSTDALTRQDADALARFTGFISTVAGAMWDLSSTAGDAVGTGVMRIAGEGSR